MTGRARVLYVSDSLGTPVHPRGIFNYSLGLIEMLKDLGWSVTLVVEKIPGYGLPDKAGAAPHIVAANRGEIYRYFMEQGFRFDWRYPNRVFRFLAEKMTPVARLLQAIDDRIRGITPTIVDNNLDELDYVPRKVSHLAKMDGFALRRLFYSSSVTRGANDLSPVPIDATGFDAVVIDTPHFVRVQGVVAERIFCVVHDLIPIADPFMVIEWRRVFFRKLNASLAHGGPLIFVSEVTKRLFHEKFPDRRPRREVVLYPTIKRSLRHAATLDDAPSAYMRRLDQERARAGGRVADRRAGRVWNPALPFFATVVSDEPRKNIPILIEAFKHLTSVANLVVIGMIDGHKYIDHAPDRHPNLHFTGYIAEAEKVDILRHSAGVIFPSFSEGFGIPIVEGAVMGVPVLCSDIPIFREVAGQDARYFDPYDAASLVEAVTAVVGDRTGSIERASALRRAVTSRFSQDAMRVRLASALREAGAAIGSDQRHVATPGP